ncbi:MAG: thiamine pyrophosphate-dependent enzyme, partial [bacterium]|nr:thiamine pyrophosphate-dependent enzyme [bacterium]
GNFQNNIIAVIGDSTFAHSGITGLLNAAYNKRATLTIILDNGTTAMTGMQENPASGRTLKEEPTVSLDYRKLALSFGIREENFKVIDAFNIKEIEETVRAFLKKNELALIIIKGLCRILYNRGEKSKADRITAVDREKCTKCNICLNAGCPAILKIDDRITINTELCSNCTVCVQLCPRGAIHEKKL